MLTPAILPPGAIASLYFVPALFLFILSPCTTQAAPPNILLIVADDLGYSDIGCYGSEIATPNLDALAERGLRFTQFYNTARCWPTRAALLTGYYAQQVGRDALPDVPGGGAAKFQRPAWAPLLPELLKPQGYRCYHSGKWHIDGPVLAGGFDRSLSMEDHDRFFNPKHWTLDDKQQQPIAPETDYYVTTAVAEHAIDCLQDHFATTADRPFFQYVAFTSPHFPLQAPASDIAKYRDRYATGWDATRNARWQRMQELGLREPGLLRGTLSPLEPEIGPPYHFPKALEALGAGEVNRELAWQDLNDAQQAFQAAKMEVHAAMIDRMDQEIGRIMAVLQEKGAVENTLVLFLSDNGASAEIMVRGDGHDLQAAAGSAASYLCLGPGWSSAANTPFRRHKTWVHEGGISTPLIVSWPAAIPYQGGLRDQVGHVVDIVPTLLAVAGAAWPTEIEGQARPASPGMNLIQAFDDTATPLLRTLWWYHEGNRALRHGDMKIVAAKDEPWQLYDLATDRSEMHDLATQQPDLLNELLEQWQTLTDEFTELRH